MTASAYPDFGAAVERTQHAVAALLGGDPEPEKTLWSRRDDITLANPYGGFRRGWQEVEAGLDLAASGFAGGDSCTFDEIARHVGTDTAYVFQMERFRSDLTGGRGVAEGTLRVVMIFRLEDGEWKLVHRQADTLTEPQSQDRADTVGRMRTLHTAYRVTDLKVSRAFYVALGYREVGRVDVGEGASLTMLRFPDEDVVTLELAHRPDAGAVEIGSGFSHLVVQVDDIVAAIETLTAAGLRPEPWAHPGGPDGPRTSWLSDPDGYRIELVQWPPGHPSGITDADFD